jgi:ComF family protein
LATGSISRLGRLALDLLYPPRCALCGRAGAFLCTACRDALPVAGGSRCPTCWLPLTGAACRACRDHPLALTALRSVYRYEGETKRLVHAFKFRYLSAVADSLSASVAATALEAGLEADTVVPVPLAPGREKERGFNQSRLLARGVGGRLGLPMLEPLRRARSATAQALSTSAAQRRENVENAFAIRRGASVAGQRLLLVDDVATTCATLDACARTLLAAGAIRVAAVTFARED